jgi:ATP-dependent RNA helicase RhlE
MHQNRGINRTFVPIIVRVGLTLPVFPSVYYQHRIIRHTTPGQNRYAMTFQELNLIEPLKRAVAEKGYTTPTPIQQQAIPPALEGRDLMGCAQTGTGKTAAFTLPILQLLAAEPRTKGRRTIKALVLTPTRELAIQIDECCRDYARYTPIRHCVIFGGVNQRPQVDALQRGLDLADQAAFAVTDAQGEGAVGFSGGPVSRVGKDFVAVRELFDGGVALLLGFLQHAGEELAEILYILLVHISLPKLAL